MDQKIFIYAGLATGTYHWKYIDSVLDNTKYLLALTIVGKGDFASGNRFFEDLISESLSEFFPNSF